MDKYEVTVKTDSKKVLEFLIGEEATKIYSEHGATISPNEKAGKVFSEELTEELSQEEIDKLFEKKE